MQPFGFRSIQPKRTHLEDSSVEVRHRSYLIHVLDSKITHLRNRNRMRETYYYPCKCIFTNRNILSALEQNRLSKVEQEQNQVMCYVLGQGPIQHSLSKGFKNQQKQAVSVMGCDLFILLVDITLQCRQGLKHTQIWSYLSFTAS